MTPSIRRKLESLAESHEEIGLLLAQPDVLADANRFRELSREYAQIEPVAAALREHDGAERELAETRAMLYDPRWGWHAAAELGGEVFAPPQYWRSQPSTQKALFGKTTFGAR